MNWGLLIQSMVISACVALMCIIVGVAGALAMSSVPRWARVALSIMGVTILVMPPFVLTNAFLRMAVVLSGSEWLPFSPLSAASAVVVMAATYWPLTMFAMWAAWTRVDMALLEIEPAATGFCMVRFLLLPLGRQALAAAAIITFVLALNNFPVSAVLQAKTYAVEVWISYNSGLNWADALTASLPMVAAPMLLLGWLWRGGNVPLPTLSNQGSLTIFARQAGRTIVFGSISVTALACLASLSPMVNLICSSETWTALKSSHTTIPKIAQASFFSAAITAVLCASIGLLAAMLASGRVLMVTAWLFWLIPGTVLGILVAQALGFAWLGPIRDSILSVVLVLTIRYMALGISTGLIAVHSCGRDLADVARLDGASIAQRIRHVYWPQSGWLVLAGASIVFLFGLWEVECVLPVVPPGSDTLPLRIFNLLHYGHTPAVNALCIVLLALGIVPFLAGGLFLLIRRRTRKVGLALACAAPLWTGCVPDEPTPSALSSKVFGDVQIIGSKGAGLGQFTKPRSLALDSSDNLYVADMTGRVQKFSPEGAFILSWQMSQTDLGRPNGMARDNDGNIIVIEPHYSRVNHFNENGKLVLQWGRHGTNQGDLAFPRAAAASKTGRIYVSEYGRFERVQWFEINEKQDSLSVRFLGSVGAAGHEPGQFNRPEGLGIDSEGRVFVADSCNHRIQVLDPSGRFIGTFGKAGSGFGQFSYPYDITVDKSGFRFVCEFGNSRIQVFDSDNRPVEIIGSPGTKPGQFNNPWAVALDSKGNLFVADSQNHRVQKLIRRT